MTAWKIEPVGKKPKLRSPILIEGLPGIGNVGKVTIDFLIEELKAKKIYEITSHSFPHSVFVNEENLVELPKIEMFYKHGSKHDFLLLGGDVQPTDEVSSYEFSESILDLFHEFGGKEIITLGGIGLAEIPKKPKIYCTGNNKNIVQRYKEGTVDNKLYGVVGPIVGVSGLLVGLAKNRKIDAIAFLAETYGHPMYLGIKGAMELLKFFDKKFDFKINMKRLNEEVKEIESDILHRTEQIEEVARRTALKKLKGRFGEGIDYIG